MTYTFKKRGTAIAGLTLCAALGATLAGCNGGGAGSSGETLATVGDAKITRADLNTFLEAQQGEVTLPYLIDTQLVLDALKAKNLDVTDAEVDADLARREATDPKVKELIEKGGGQLASARGQIKRDLAMQKLLTADIKPTDAQLKAYLAKNSRYYDSPAKIKLGLLFSSTKVRADLMARELKSKTKTFEALVTEQKAAKDLAGQQSTAVRDTFEPMDSLPPNVAAALAKLPKGGTSAPEPFNLGQPTPVYIIFKKVDVQAAKKASLTDPVLRAQIETDYKLTTIAEKTAAENPANPPFDQTLIRTQQYLQSQNPTSPPPQLRDVLSFINQAAANKLLNDLRAGGTVQISDPAYAKVGQAYQAAPAAGAAPATGSAPASAAPVANAASTPAK